VLARPYICLLGYAMWRRYLKLAQGFTAARQDGMVAYTADELRHVCATAELSDSRPAQRGRGRAGPKLTATSAVPQAGTGTPIEPSRIASSRCPGAVGDDATADTAPGTVTSAVRASAANDRSRSRRPWASRVRPMDVIWTSGWLTAASRPAALAAGSAPGGGSLPASTAISGSVS
jgi:hypothetical protein